MSTATGRPSTSSRPTTTVWWPFNPAEDGGEPEVIEALSKKADTFVHETRSATSRATVPSSSSPPSDRNRSTWSQHGEVVMAKWDGKTYARSIVDPGGHPREGDPRGGHRRRR